jgi:PAS domain S-box-containing protein
MRKKYGMESNEMVKSDGIKEISGSSAAYMGVIDSEGNFVFINSYFHKSLSSNVLEILHKTFYDFIHPDDLEKCRHAVACCLLTGDKYNVEIRLKGAVPRCVKWQITSIGKAGDFVQRFLLSGADIDGERPDKRKLALNSHHYEAILEKMNVGILLQDKNGSVMAANQKTAEIFNAALEQVYQHNAFEQLWKTTQKDGNQVLFENSPPMEAIRTGQTQTHVLVCTANEGHDKRHLLINAQPVFDTDPHSPSFVVSTLADITEEKNLKALCEQREALFTSFMNHSPSFTWIVDEDEKLVFANQGLLTYFGADNRVLNKSIYQILPKPIAEAAHEKHKWVMENNLPHSSILKSLQADGDEQVFQVITFPVNGEHSTKMVGGQAWDITESYHAKRQLGKINERLLYLNRAASEAIWDWNMLTGQIFRNEALLKLIGYHQEKPCGLGWWYKQIHPEDRVKVEDKIENILASKEKAWEQEYRFLCADGLYKIVLDRGFVVYQDNNPVRMVGSLQDISEIKQLEALLVREKLKRQQQVAEAILQAQEQERTRIGHELHDNVNQILFTCKLYLDSICAPEDEEKGIKEKTTELLVMAIEEIRKLSKELVSPRLKESGLIACIDELIDQLGVVDPFHVHFVPEDKPKIESLDYNIKVTLFRIIQEQIKNIIAHSEARNVSLHLSVRQKKVHLLVEDDGVGFDASQTRRGIGLSNIYERTNLYNGKVVLKTEPGNGCSMLIIIPSF